MIRAAFTGFFFLTACEAFGQPTPGILAFDVASVKQDTVGTDEGPGRGREIIQVTPEGLTMRNTRLSSALKWAYRLQTDQIIGPAWLDSGRYLIVAKCGSPVPDQSVRLMLRALLVDRFKMTVHNATKVLSAFVLAVDKGGPKFKPSEEPAEGKVAYGKGNSVVATNATLSQFVDALTNPLHALVLDETGLKARYTFTLDLNIYEPGNIPPEDMPTVLGRGLREELGLKLESKKSPLPVLVIDHAERVPTGN